MAIMRSRALLTALALTAATAAASPVQATIILTPGNNPQPGEANVTFADQSGSATLLGDIGGGTDNFSITGTTVLGADTLSSTSNVITGSDSAITSVTLTPLDGTLNALIFDLVNASGSLTLSALDGEGNVFSTSFAGGLGQNFFTFTTAGGETIASVTVSSTGSFESLRSVRGVFASTAVPEASTWAMMLLGFGAVGSAIRRRKQTELTSRRAA
jgi:hypothetical protein